MSTTTAKIYRPRLRPVPETAQPLRELVFGVDRLVPIAGGEMRPYVNLDNAATTPAFCAVVQKVNEFLEVYGSVHRGTGYKSRQASQAYDMSRLEVAAWLGIDPDYHAVIFTRGTTDSLNKAARTLARRGRRVLCTLMEHHSNLLPWRQNGEVVYAGTREDGGLDLDQIEDILRRERGAIGLLAVTGASNVTGLTPPIYDLARMAHEHGAEILVDAAQLAPHSRLRAGNAAAPDHLDYVAFSAHKMYAPFGSGVLVAPRGAFAGNPESVGGGAVRLVTEEETVWADAPTREEPGTPNVVGAVALAKAISILDEAGMDRIAEHERSLRDMMLRRLREIPGVRLFGQDDAPGHGRVGVIAFDAPAMPHGLIAAALGHEHGIGVRHGCFCAHLYLARLLHVGKAALAEHKREVIAGDFSRLPGLVRLSFGLYNTAEEVDYAADAIERLLSEGPRLTYRMEERTGEYIPD